MNPSPPIGHFGTRALDWWQRWWFSDIPPHIYSVLRILFGLLACATLLGVRDLGAFWDLSGLVTAQDKGLGLKAYFLAHNLGDIAGRWLFFASLAVYVSMTVGFRSAASVALALIVSLVDVSWNYLPHSGAYVALQAFLFCLIWADTGSVWSVDALLERRRGIYTAPSGYPIAPLRLIRLQVGLIYLGTGLRKLYSPQWRDGSALHYVLNNNVYQRFPHSLPVQLDPLATILTYVVLVWELGFLFALCYAPTKRLVLVLGVFIHLGIMAGIEIGPFSWVMLASYAAFIDPSWIASSSGKAIVR